jgi:hypothetical protein
MSTKSEPRPRKSSAHSHNNSCKRWKLAPRNFVPLLKHWKEDVKKTVAITVTKWKIVEILVEKMFFLLFDQVYCFLFVQVVP